MKTAVLGIALVCAIALTSLSQSRVEITAAAKSASTFGFTNGWVAKKESGKAFTIFGYNSAAVEQWIFIFSTNQVPADTTKPRSVPPIRVPAKHNFSIVWPGGRNFTNGITVVNSLSETEVLIGAADCSYEATFGENMF